MTKKTAVAVLYGKDNNWRWKVMFFGERALVFVSNLGGLLSSAWVLSEQVVVGSAVEAVWKPWHPSSPPGAELHCYHTDDAIVSPYAKLIQDALVQLDGPQYEGFWER